MSVQQDLTNTFAGTPQTNPRASDSLPYTDVCHITLGCKKWKGSLEKLIVEELRGCGQAILHKLDIVAVTPETGAFVKCGVAEVNSNVSLDALAMKANGVYHVAGSAMFPKNTFTIIPEETLADQIRPISSIAPMIELSIERSEKAVVVIDLYYKIPQIRQFYKTLN